MIDGHVEEVHYSNAFGLPASCRKLWGEAMSRIPSPAVGIAIVLALAPGPPARADGDLKQIGTIRNDAIHFAVEAKTYGTNRLFVTSRGDPNNDVFLGGVSVWDLSRPEAPSLQDAWRPDGATTHDDAQIEGQDLLGGTFVVVAQRARTAGANISTGILYVLDASDALRGGRLTELGRAPILYPTETGRNYAGLHVKIWEPPSRSRRFALVTSPRFDSDKGGVIAVDITDPHRPQRVAAVATHTTNAEGIEVVGSYAYVGGAYSDSLVRLSLSGLMQPQPKLRVDAQSVDSRYNNMVSEFDAATRVLYSANWCTAYPSCDTGGLLAFDASGEVIDIARPLSSNVTTEFHHANRVRLSGDVAYLALQGADAPGIGIVDISDPRGAGIGGGRRVWMPPAAGPLYTLASYGGYVYAFGATTSTMFIMKAVDPVIDAVVSLGDDYTYVFSGDRYVKYLAPRSPGVPWTPVPSHGVKPIAGNWGLKGASESFNHGFDAIARLKDGMLYGFRGAHFVRYADGVVPSVVDEGYPKNICPSWGSLPADFCEGFDSIVYSPRNDRLYVTKGSRYIRYADGDLRNNWSGPYNIAGNWGDLPQEYLQGFDAMTVVGDKLYVFKGSTFTRYANQGVGKQTDETLPISSWGAIVRRLN